jgi:hypothetical protein
MIRDRLTLIDKEGSLSSIKTEAELLAALEITREEYVLAIRTSIRNVTVFLKRTYRELMVNNYNKLIYLVHQYNMDIQFVTDAYGCGAYLMSYLLKTRPLYNEILRKAFSDARRGNHTLQQRLMRISSQFTNATQSSLQECIMNLLGARLTDASRETVFVNTFPPNERYLLLRSDDVLQMQSKGQQVYALSQQQKYSARPMRRRSQPDATAIEHDMTDVCFAYFCTHYDYVSKSEASNTNDWDQNK